MKYDHIHDALFDLTGGHYNDEEIQRMINDQDIYLEPNSWDLNDFINFLCRMSIGMNVPRFGDTEGYKFDFNQSVYKLNDYLIKYKQ